MYVSAEFSAKIDKSIIIPATAVFQTEEESFVFVEANPGLFVRRRIKYSRDNEVLAVVHSGLTPGENIIVNGGILLLEAR
ncbi:MAG: hypothetical protein IPJ37_06585 [Bacteroidales bacterium]|nr:hypothetical protein [Bacteroidales bacterium]